ncbi:MAG: RidA family protein [Betaproteobacteria bacterium]
MTAGRAARRQLVSSGTVWEPIVGYSRAVRVGDWVFVAGTTATDTGGNIVGKGDAAAQMRQVMANIELALTRAGATCADVVRTRIFVTDIGNWEPIGRIHGEIFGAIRPAATMVEVQRLIDPDLLVEVEVDAIIGSGDAG